MSEKKTLTEGHIRGQIKGDVKPRKIQNGKTKPPSASQKPSGAPPAPQPKGKK